MQKVHGKRYAYKFDFHGLMAACQAQAQGGDPTNSMLAAANYNKYAASDFPGSLYPTPTPPPPSITTHPSALQSSVAGPSTQICSTNMSSSTTSFPTVTTSAASYWPYGRQPPL